MTPIKEEWKKGLKPFNPKDELFYFIPNEVIHWTEVILREYGKLSPPSEGLVYWAGERDDKKIIIKAVIAPSIISNEYWLEVGHQSNSKVIDILGDLEQIHLAQIHSHPSKWVGHSETDDKNASFKHNGLLSIVVPHFGMEGMKNLSDCGVHRFMDGRFAQLNKKYIRKHFSFTNHRGQLIDLRNDY